MATIATTHGSSLPMLAILRTKIAQIAEASRQRREYLTTLRELNALSGRDLADLGICRANIQSIAFEAVYGK